MCLATPVKIVDIKKEKLEALVGDQGKEKSVNISLVSEAKKGDWLLCHDDMAINIIGEKQALEILDLAKSCPHGHDDHHHH